MATLNNRAVGRFFYYFPGGAQNNLFRSTKTLEFLDGNTETLTSPNYDGNTKYKTSLDQVSLMNSLSSWWFH